MHEPRATAGVARAQVAGASTTRSARVALALIVALVATLLGGLPGTAGADARPVATDLDMTRVVVQARQDIGAAASTVAAHGGRVLEIITPLGIVVAEVPADAVAAIETDASTASVTADFPLRVQSADDARVDRAAARARARTKPRAGAGDGAGIVVVDTGIAERDDLNVVASYDLTTGKGNHRGNRKGAPSQDAHGHGTFMAGVAAGSGEYPGTAPGAPLVSVRVADAEGNTTLSRVLHGLAIADAARSEHDAPVVLLALAGEPGDTADPLMITLEMLWARGSTVVVPSGNRGEEGMVTSPGADPYLITAGAVDADGNRVAWSGQGEPFGHPKPELHAPGVSVVGPRVEGSTIATEPNGELGHEYMRGSGTSMAAAHVAGQAAAILTGDSSLTPTQVKSELMGATANVALEPLPEAVNPDRGNRRATAPGQMRRTAKGLQTAGWTWAGWTWAGWTWAGRGDVIDGEDWAGWTWADGEWAGWTWANEDWAGWTWADDEWAGWTWAGWTWAGWTWAGWTWAATDWGTLH